MCGWVFAWKEKEEEGRDIHWGCIGTCYYDVYNYDFLTALLLWGVWGVLADYVGEFHWREDAGLIDARVGRELKGDGGCLVVVGIMCLVPRN